MRRPSFQEVWVGGEQAKNSLGMEARPWYAILGRWGKE